MTPPAPESSPQPIAPISYLKALTEEAIQAVGARTVVINRYPFRVGRENRQASSPKLFTDDRRRLTTSPNNDLYIRDRNPTLFVSREHFEIRWDGRQFTLVDRQSVVGTWVDGKLVGGDRGGGETPLFPNDVIIVGSHEGGFIFKFLA